MVTYKWVLNIYLTTTLAKSQTYLKLNVYYKLLLKYNSLLEKSVSNTFILTSKPGLKNILHNCSLVQIINSSSLSLLFASTECHETTLLTITENCSLNVDLSVYTDHLYIITSSHTLLWKYCLIYIRQTPVRLQLLELTLLMVT